ncbi:type II toxin-antitoxin system mRNA interferase toxin, RelE/StbE family [Candidatus Azambacteria bacterium]|nr:type II toxin-antitoxin system mRNA interferase toxin, RelE/StbE family [Candidatus Azambacteria bacterium]
MQIIFHKNFVKKLSKLPLKAQNAFYKKLEVFYSDKFNVLLNNHPLSGEYDDKRSINITGDYRAIFEERENGDVIFILIGTHSELYK